MKKIFDENEGGGGGTGTNPPPTPKEEVPSKWVYWAGGLVLLVIILLAVFN